MAFKMVMLSMMLLASLQYGLTGQVHHYDNYIIVLKPSVSMKSSLGRIKSRSADPDEPIFSATVDKNSVFQDIPNAASFQVFCDDETARLIASEEHVALVEKDSEISIEGY